MTIRPHCAFWKSAQASYLDPLRRGLVLPNGLDGGKLWGVGCRIFDKGLAHVASIAVAPDNRGTAAIAVCAGAAGGDIRTPLRSPALSSFPSGSFRGDLVGGIVSSAVAIPLAIGFGMFAFVSLGDQYFAWGAVSGLISALVVGMVNVVLGDRSTMVYAPRVTTTFFLGLLLNSLLHSDAIRTPSASAALAVFFAIVLAGGVFQALFGLTRLGTLIKFTPHPVMAGFQNMAAALLFLVQIGNVLGFDKSIGFTRAFGYLGSARPLSVLVAGLTFPAMWHARKLTAIVPPLLVGLGCGIAAYYFLLLAGFGTALGPVIGLPTASATMNNVLAAFPVDQWPNCLCTRRRSF